MPKMDSLSHFHSRNVYFYIHFVQLKFKSYDTFLFFNISGLTPTLIIFLDFGAKILTIAHLVNYSYLPPCSKLDILRILLDFKVDGFILLFWYNMKGVGRYGESPLSLPTFTSSLKIPKTFIHFFLLDNLG